MTGRQAGEATLIFFFDDNGAAGSNMTAGQKKVSWLPAIAATLIMVLVAMGLFMTPIATRALVQEFDTSAGMVQAAIALLSLVLASLCILGGKLGDIYSKKRVFVIGLVLYGISALITALLPSILVLIAGFRAPCGRGRPGCAGLGDADHRQL